MFSTILKAVVGAVTSIFVARATDRKLKTAYYLVIIARGIISGIKVHRPEAGWADTVDEVLEVMRKKFPDVSPEALRRAVADAWTEKGFTL